MPAKCKLCPASFANFTTLKSHWRSEHPRAYVQVQTWLADVDEAVVVAECVVERQEKGIDFGEEK